MNFGEKFKHLVEASGESYEKVAAALGLKSRSSISHYINNVSSPKHSMLIKICDYFGVSPSYFDESPIGTFHQNELAYETQEHKIPVFFDETTDAKQISYMVIPHSGITDGYAVLINDTRLESIGIPCGSTVILSKKFILLNKHKVIAQQGEERFFATYEKIRENHAVIVPVNPDRPPVVLDDKMMADVKIYAVVKSVIFNE